MRLRFIMQIAIVAILARAATAQSSEIRAIELPDVAFKSGDAEFIQTLQVSHDKLRRGTEMQVRYILSCWREMCINGVESPEDGAVPPILDLAPDSGLQVFVPKLETPLRKGGKEKCAYPNYLVRIRAPRDLPLGVYIVRVRLTWQPRGKDGVLQPQVTSFEIPIQVVERDANVRQDKDNFNRLSAWGTTWRLVAFPFYMAGCAAGATVGKPYCIE